jgi:hypothetical protein
MENKFKTKEELFDHLVENKEDLIYAKKCIIKEADSISVVEVTKDVSLESVDVNKTDQEQINKVPVDSTLKVRAVINTTNWMDSHKDVHIPGIWKRSLNNNHRIKHIQEHQMSFDKIIADKADLVAKTEKVSWKELGLDIDGETEALIFDSTVKETRNPFMHKQYAEGNVDNHSVGMQYVKIKLAVNSDKEEHKNEKSNWDEFYPMIANKDEADRHGYFWAVTEAKVLEGSAVVNGSNPITPTLTQSKTTKGKEEIQLDQASLEEKAIKQFLNI